MLFFAMNSIYLGYFVACDITSYTQSYIEVLWTLYIACDVYDLYNAYSLVLTCRDIRVGIKKLFEVKYFHNSSISVLN
uniref:Uncharacterized protein n=1 Tax=Acrobeloides nanus TaxID=290746 RepID=A0A914CRJ5_9BILA